MLTIYRKKRNNETDQTTKHVASPITYKALIPRHIKP